MATTGRTTDGADDATDVASLLRAAEFVQLVGAPDGDALAAVGILGNALDTLETPYQVSMATSVADAESRLLDRGTTLGLGLATGDGHLADDSTALGAYDVASTLDADPDPVLAIAGAIAGGVVPSGKALDAAEANGVVRRPGVGLPTADIGAGLAFSGRLHGSFSGDEQSAGAFLADLSLPAELDDDAQTRLASAVALDVAGSTATGATTDALESVLAPFDALGPFETVEGYADVLDTLAATDPGIGVAFVLGYEEKATALEAWKTAGKQLHQTVARLALESTDDVAYGTIEAGAPRSVARLVRDFRHSAPAVLVSGPTSIAIATTDMDARALLSEAFEDDLVTGTDTLAVADTDGTADTVAETVQEAR